LVLFILTVGWPDVQIPRRKLASVLIVALTRYFTRILDCHVRYS